MFTQGELMEIQNYIYKYDNYEDDEDKLNELKTEGVIKYLDLSDEDRTPIYNMIIKNIRKKKPTFKLTREEKIELVKSGKPKNK